MKGAALDLAPKKIRVNSVNPGMIDTDLFEGGNITKEQDQLNYPLKRYGRPKTLHMPV